MPADLSRCRSIVPPSPDACGQPVTYRITFSDGDRLNVCEGCKLRFEQIAAGYGRALKAQRLADLGKS